MEGTTDAPGVGMNMDKHSSNRVLTATLLLAALEFCPLAPAQNALDRNLQVGSGGINAPTPTNTYGQYGNAVITGNVGGLGAFHHGPNGSPYRAAGEFGGSLGTDSTQSFLLRSMPNSTLTTRGAYVPGGAGYINPQLNANAAVANTFGRAGAGVNVGQISGQAGTLPTLTPYTTRVNDVTGINFSPVGASLGAIESGTIRPQTQTIGYTLSPTGQIIQLNSSPLMGIQQVPVDPLQRVHIPADQAPAEKVGEPAVPKAGLETDKDKLDKQSDAGDRDSRLDTRLTGMPWGDTLGERLGDNPDRRVALPVFKTDVIEQNIFDRKIMTSAKPGEDVYADLLRRIKSQADQKGKDKAMPAPGTPGSPGTPPQDQLVAPAKPGSAPAKTRTEQIMEEYERFKRGELKPEQMKTQTDWLVNKLDYQLPPIRTMAGGKETGFNNVVTTAEKEMASGNFFKAQAAYARAIALQPDNPLVQFGQVHSQIGAGIYMTAALGLRDVLARHPEMIAAKYGASLMPGGDRMTQINEELSSLLTGSARPEAALLAAYLAYQENRPSELRYALDELSKRSPNDPLVPLLRRIWMTNVEFKPRLEPDKPAPGTESQLQDRKGDSKSPREQGAGSGDTKASPQK